jgi:hypothetical protein
MNLFLVLLIFGLFISLFMYRKKLKRDIEESLQMEVTQKDVLQEANADETVVLHEEIRVLTTMDAAMIKARIEKLELVTHLEDNKQERLFRKVLDMCKKGTEGLWWEPLAWFARNLRTKDDQTIVILNSRRITLNTIANINEMLSVITRLGELQFVRVEMPENDFDLDEEYRIADGTYKMIYSRRGKAGHFPLIVEDQKFDVVSWMREVNKILRRIKVPFRFLMLAPKEDLWCIVYTPVVAAERAIRSRWGIV